MAKEIETEEYESTKLRQLVTAVSNNLYPDLADSERAEAVDTAMDLIELPVQFLLIGALQEVVEEEIDDDELGEIEKELEEEGDD